MIGRESPSYPLTLTELPSFANSRAATSNDGRGLLRLDRFRRRLSPIPIGFLGLMVAIVLWGTAYKLSLYHPHPAPSTRTQVAKLWLETRTSYVVPLREIKRVPVDGTHLHALAGPIRPFPDLIVLAGCPDHLSEKQLLTPAGSMPSRSPPCLSLCQG